ncbi:FAD-dependent monooxygenase [Streptomyces sp. B-S-A8]|uniref:FAD-dependent monooxygenase n=1 Tax=Streptomyces solicavernae TaxID=3043614 RepID=A0ABT6RYE8_9ACTN|nr:FAD-dependent monooxygenase [Streptomyces sp. B-S-A8]MDI3389457.1 FAD-dependent monooxygenase [Streptomyces sp. B-S-A8]
MQQQNPNQTQTQTQSRNQNRTVLINGGGIAGPVLAYWLHRHGLRPTVVERADGPRPGGQAVDIRGVALDVVERMGLLEAARKGRTRMRGMSVLDAEGREIDRSTEFTYSSGRLDSDDIELLREDLVRMVYEHTRGVVEYRFGDGVATLDEDADGVHVGFTHGPPRTFDLVVGADGLHSAVRRLAFGPEPAYAHHLGSCLSVFSAGNFLGLDRRQVWLRDGDAGFGIMPVRDDTELRVAFGFGTGPDEYDFRDGEALRAAVVDRLAALKWEGARLAEAARTAPDFYCDAMAQIRMDHWTRGRVALLGDAGYCPSPLSGQGTSLALVGAYVLADSLAREPYDHRAAHRRYEQRMRPFVALNQALATENEGGPAAEESVTRAKNAIRLDG